MTNFHLVLLVGVNAIWGFNFIAGKIGTVTFGPWLFINPVSSTHLTLPTIDSGCVSTGAAASEEKRTETGSFGMGARRLAGGPEGGSEGAEVGNPESLPEGS